MSEFFQSVGSVAVTVFVLTSLLNVGMTQKPTRLLQHLKNGAFLLRMLLLNLLVVPALMIAALELVPLEPHYANGLLVFAISAGAPFLIKLTHASESDVALGATVMLVLIVGTVIVMPLLLPQLVEGTEVDPWAIVQSMLTQMILPLVVGMLLLQFAERFVAVVQPWVARISNIALYLSIIAIIIGYLPAFADVELWKALAVGIVVILLALFLGWTMGDHDEQLRAVGGLGTAQRGTAAAIVVAQGTFDDPRVLVVIILLNTLGVVLLIAAAKLMSRDNTFDFLIPQAADVPEPSSSQKQGD